MAFTYNTPALSDRDRLRLLVGDTKAERPIFEDAELDDLLALETNLYATAALACRVMATDSAKRAVAMSAPGMTWGATEVSRRLMELADKYEAQAQSRTQAAFATVYGQGDALIDAVMGRGDIDADVPIDYEAGQ